MNKFYSNRVKKQVYEIFSGEYYVTNKSNIVLSTLLGSCVSVCMRDSFNKISGINHIMLSSSFRVKDMLHSKDARYGIHAMELMINDMLKMGARKERLEAKVFGGANVLKSNANKVASYNVEFALNYLDMEEIPILAKDVGGNGGRKITFFPDDFSIYLKRIRENKTLIAGEENYLKNIKERGNKTGDLTFFNN